MKLIIAGTRPPKEIMMDALLVEEWHDDRIDSIPLSMGFLQMIDGFYPFPNPDLKIIGGCAWGWDEVGRRWAIRSGHEYKPFHPAWYPEGKYDIGAGYKRNREMARYADALLAFHDGVSRGTQNMIDEMLKRHKPVYIMKLEDHRPVLR